MKIAFIAPYKNGTGYAHAAISYMMALDSVGVTVVPREVYMIKSSGYVPKRIVELEQNNLNNVDVTIQFNLPSEFGHKAGTVNGCGFCYETNTLKYTGWIPPLKEMDFILVPSFFQSEILNKEVPGVANYVMPYPLSVAKYGKEYEKIDFKLPQNAYKFYTIAELAPRKELQATIIAYLSEFTLNDNVALVIKTNVPGKSPEGPLAAIGTTIKQCKESLGIYTNPDLYPPIIAITDYLDDEGMCRIHKSCNTFLSSSRGESYCLPAVDAMAFGNHIIVPNNTCFKDGMYAGASRYESMQSVVFNGNHPTLYSGREKWHTPCTADMAVKMRNAYENRLKHPNTPQLLEVLKYENIGNLLLECVKNHAE